MDESLRRDIDRFVEENSERLVRDIGRLVAVNSVEGKAEEGAPYGPGPRRALELGLEIAGELGLDTVNCEGRIGYAQIGEGEDYLATISHLDVVPVAEGWKADPFVMREREGWLIGRGVLDDKGPSVVCLYALRFLKERGVALRYPIRALLGANEETGMADVEYYLDNFPAPLFCFSPDASFPVCNGEKGIFHGRIISRLPLGQIVDIRGGVAPNVIPDKAEAWVKAENLSPAERVETEETEPGLWHLTARGVGGHASMPKNTVNAIGVLVDYLLESNVGDENDRRILNLLAMLQSNTDGSGVGIASDDGRFDPLTVVGGVIGVEDGRLFQTVDSRYPTSTSGEAIMAALRERAGDCADIVCDVDKAPFFIEADNPAVKACIDAYNAVTGENAKPYTMGGGTYARHFPNAVAFGPEHPDRPAPSFAGPVHGAEEACCREYLLEALKVYILALLELEKLDY